MKRTVLAACAVAMLSTGSAYALDLGLSIYGQLKVEKSDFDNMTTVSVTPGLVRNKDSKFSWPAPFRLGMFWNQQYPKLIALVVEMDGVRTIDKLESKIGDNIVSYPTTDRLPNWSKNKVSTTVSTKSFFVTPEQLQDLLTAEKVMLRVDNVSVGYFHVETSSMDPTAKKGIMKGWKAIQPFINPQAEQEPKSEPAAATVPDEPAS